MLELYAEAYRYAKRASNVLIRGASGAGKEHLARYMHLVSPFASGPFIGRNMSTIPSDLFESVMFGVMGRTVSGVTATIDGDFVQAANGTLLLDELGATQPSHQAKLLRVLQTREFFRLHGTAGIKVTCNVMAATNENVETWAKAGDFRQDLYFRFPLVLMVPSLSERREEIPELARALLSRELTTQGKQGIEFAPMVLEQLTTHKLPKNIRSIEEGVMRAVSNKSSHSLIQWKDLKLDEQSPDTEQRGVPVVTSRHVLKASALESSPTHVALPNTETKDSLTPEANDSLSLHLRKLREIHVGPYMPELPGILCSLDESTGQLRRDLAYAALYRCRHPVSGKIKVQTAMQLLSGDEQLSSTNANRLLNALLGHKQTRDIDPEEIQGELDRREYRMTGVSNGEK